MDELLKQRAAILKAAQDIVNRAKAENRDLSDDELTDVETKTNEVKELDGKIARARKSAELVQAVGGLAPDESHENANPREKRANTLGEHFVKHVGARLKDMRGVAGTLAAPEYDVKAPADTHVTDGPTGSLSAILTQIDRTIVAGYRRPLAVVDLLGSGTLSGQAITYFIEGGLEGTFGWVAEAAQKPQLHIANPTPKTETLKEIAGWARFSDNMVDDLDFIVSEINNRLLYQLALTEEQAIILGDGTGNGLLGLLNRSGIQTEAAANDDDVADAVFRALTKVPLATGLQADGIVINPADYQGLRLSRDANGQYFGGGFFAGQYGNGGITIEPPLWGRNTVVTPAIPAGTVLVGAFAQGGTVYRKGGVRVEWTNSHADDFTNDRVVVRAKERLALAVRRPAAFVEITLA